MNTEEENPIESDPTEQTHDSQTDATAADLEVDAAFADHGDSENQPANDSDSDFRPVTIESLQAELAESKKRELIAHADLENFRRRNRREMHDQVRYASLGLMNELLESVDNLHRAVDSFENDASGESLVEGVKLVAQQISTALENKGCKKIEAVGQPFDPNLHQALQMQPSDEHDANVVLMDLRPGFQLHDRVIRPSQVFVSTGPAKE